MRSRRTPTALTAARARQGILTVHLDASESRRRFSSRHSAQETLPQQSPRSALTDCSAPPTSYNSRNFSIRKLFHCVQIADNALRLVVSQENFAFGGLDTNALVAPDIRPAIAGAAD